jgi:dTDP-D-glucose 4,6-dehydratase
MMPMGQSALLKPPRKVWLSLQNKKLSIYGDGPEQKNFIGIIDFNKIPCIIVIEDSHCQSNISLHEEDFARF